MNFGLSTERIFASYRVSNAHQQLTQLAADLSVNEIIVQDMMTDHAARLRSYELLASVFELK